MQYNNGFGNYQAWQNPMGYGQNQPMQGGIIWVQGEAGAKSYLVAPGNTVLLMDSERQTFYIKSTDMNGIPKPLEIYDYAVRKTEPEPKPDMSQYVTKDELKAYIEGLRKPTKKVTEHE